MGKKGNVRECKKASLKVLYLEKKLVEKTVLRKVQMKANQSLMTTVTSKVHKKENPRGYKKEYMMENPRGYKKACKKA